MLSLSLLLLVAAAADKGDNAKPEERAEKTQQVEPAALNLLGKTDTQSGESRRNENVQFNLIDNNALKELATRVGTTATLFQEFAPTRNYFGGEYGNAPTNPIHLSAAKNVAAGIHGTLSWNHLNSVTSARSFFQAGGVLPARENQYGVVAGSPLWHKAWISIDASQQKIRGQVNGNVLVPLAGERTVLATDPAIRTILNRWLAAYPVTAPNRTDIDQRALNTNAPQHINTDSTSVRVDQLIGTKDRLFLRHTYTNQAVDAFQLVAGQNPDTTTKNHGARLTWARAFAPTTTGEFSVGLDRVHSLLVPEPGHVGPQVQIGTAYSLLGPSSGIPIDRVQNRFRYAGLVQRQAGEHKLVWGGELTRLQFNGREASSNRNNWYFRNDFGRDAITNFRLGIPSRFTTGIGDLDRAFRNWEQQYFAGDTWRALSNLTLNFGVRFSPQTGPTEIHGRNVIPYSCDCNNWAPRFGLAWRLPKTVGVVRAAYGVQFGEVFAQTFQQVRWNPPEFLKIEVNAPDMLNPLAKADLNPNGRATFFDIQRDLKAPYSHQYNLSWESGFSNQWRLQLGYVGSRTHKLFMMWHTNRAQASPTLPTITATVNDRRPDPRYFEFRRVLNGARAYFDAARATLVVPSWRRLTIDASYWFSKAIDTGATYLNTAAGDDARQGYSQSEFLVSEDLKGLSAFDQSHAGLIRVRYDIRSFRDRSRLLNSILGQWNLSAVTLAKTGMPFNVITGSDGPGFGNVDGTNGDRPMLLDPTVLGRTIGNPDTSRQLLPRSAFRFLRSGEQRGNLGANAFRRGGLFNLNASVSRSWGLAGDRALQFRAEAINGTNTPQFADPNPDLSSPAFGQITNTLNDGRSMRFTLQLRF